MDADAFLRGVVDEAGDVDYAKALEGQALDDALQTLADADLDAMDGDDRYAFLINAYNLAALDVVRRLLWKDGRQVRTLKSTFTWLRFFLTKKVRVAGHRMSLYRLEFKHLKPFLRADPRGHFALVCASTGCPPLRGGVFHGDSLDEELELAGRAFMRPGAGYEIDHRGGILWLNSIFKWYAKDFRAMGDPEDIVTRYAPADDAEWIGEIGPRIRYLKYDWDLNVAGR